MSRWRPPSPGSTAIITREGFERLKAELDHLWHVVRPEVVKAITAAAAEGDRSENAEYIYRKKQLAEIDRRARYLSKRIPLLRVAEQAPGDRNAVFFGARVSWKISTAANAGYRIVGPDETDARHGWISIDSPMARALLKKRVGDELTAALPAGPAAFALLAVSYD